MTCDNLNVITAVLLIMLCTTTLIYILMNAVGLKNRAINGLLMFIMFGEMLFCFAFIVMISLGVGCG